MLCSTPSRPAPSSTGEIVRWGRDGRLDFSALQRRHVSGRRRADLALTEPCHYVVFDLLEAGGEDLRPAPLSERRAELELLLAGLPGTSRVVLCPQLRDVGEARLWFEILVAQGVEGLVVKAADDPYREGRRGWWKVKHRTTTEAIVGGVTGPVEAPRMLILGRYTDGGRLRVVARSTPLAARDRVRLGAVLVAAGDEHPWPAEIPAGWAAACPVRRSRSGTHAWSRTLSWRSAGMPRSSMAAGGTPSGSCGSGETCRRTMLRPASTWNDALGLSGVFSCLAGAVQVGEVDVFGDLFDVATVRHQLPAPRHEEPRLPGAGVAVMGLGEDEVTVIERDHLNP
ncbi:ATP-dependent DNA ligase [Actinomadura madurae]|uniref:ATP-dependent DNA ligase n=1 Tax=Actinomadura madurae TaxID=1993 RepID=UPI0020D24183|nr:hypothetical protein [Actinomadura madurae]